MYHVIMHGKGIMGSHASQLTYDKRWTIIRYVIELRGDKVDVEMASDTDGGEEAENNEQQI